VEFESGAIGPNWVCGTAVREAGAGAAGAGGVGITRKVPRTTVLAGSAASATVVAKTSPRIIAAGAANWPIVCRCHHLPAAPQISCAALVGAETGCWEGALPAPSRFTLSRASDHLADTDRRGVILLVFVATESDPAEVASSPSSRNTWSQFVIGSAMAQP